MGNFCIDSGNNDAKKFKIQNIEARLLLNGQVYKDWQAMSQFKTDPLPRILKKNASSTLLFNDTLALNNRLLVEFRNKKTGQFLIRFNILRIGHKISPFLTHWMHDTSSQQTTIQFIQERFSTKKNELERSDYFYEYWPEKYGSLGPRNEQCFENSKFALYFRRPDQGYPDSSLEYKLTGGSLNDTTWHRTGHMILITQLEPNKHYTLFVRYPSFPANIHKSSFYVMPRWYQTIKYKIILGVIIILLLLLFLTLLYRHRIKKEKEKRARLNFEIKALRSQLNPHFVFNAMSSIQGLINKKEIDAANYYLTEFSKLLRESLSNYEKETVPVSTETGLLNTYLKLEQLRFHFEYTLSMDVSINTNDGEAAILQHNPDIVFLDIQMPGKTGFEMLQSLKNHNFELIFVTAFDQYGIQAVKFSALDYLLKPINTEELKNAVHKAIYRSTEKRQNKKLENLLQVLEHRQEKELHRIALTSAKETRFIRTQDIIRCQSSNNYTTFFLSDGEKIMTSKPIFEYEEILVNYGFIRCHQSHLINKLHIKSWVKENGGFLLLDDNTQVPISRQKKEYVKMELEKN